MGKYVNRQSGNPIDLERNLLEKVFEVLAEIGWPMEVRQGFGAHDTGLDAMVRIDTREGVANLVVDIKTNLRPSTFDAWIQRRKSIVSDVQATTVLAVPAMSDRLAEMCRESKVSWCDLAGNCRIDVPGQIHIERRGLSPKYRPPRAQANLSTKAAGRIIRVLLSPAHAGYSWTHRGLAKETVWKEIAGANQPIDSMITRHLLRDDRSVSLGLVNKVLRHLRDEDYVEEAEGGGIRVKDPVGLLHAWATAYRFERHQRLGYFTLLKANELEQALTELRPSTGGMVVYASYSAAERQAPHVRQQKTWLYAAPHCVGSLSSVTRANPVDSGENLVVLVPDDVGVMMTYLDVDSDDRTLRSTDPVQTYVDLRHSGGRGEEAARAILEQVLIPFWKRARSA